LRSMRRFLASTWFPLLICVILAGVTVAAYAGLKPTGEDIGNSEIQRIALIAGWAIGPIAGLLSYFLAGILNTIRRIIRLRRKAILHPIVVLLSITPWLIFGWQVTSEPRYTPIARAVIDFAARELLWGSLIAFLVTLLLCIPAFFARK
jgi:hypothetical protein